MYIQRFQIRNVVFFLLTVPLALNSYGQSLSYLSKAEGLLLGSEEINLLDCKST